MKSNLTIGNYFKALALVLVSLIFAISHPAAAQQHKLCVDYFGLGLKTTKGCERFSGKTIEIQNSRVTKRKINGASTLKIVSEKKTLNRKKLKNLNSNYSVHTLEVFHVGQIDLTPIKTMTGLLQLKLSADAALALPQLNSGVENLASLRIYSPRRSVDLSTLTNMPNLRVLEISAQEITGLQGLKNLKILERASFNVSKPADFTSLSSARNLRNLEINGTLGQKILTDIRFLTNLRKLNSLDVGDNNITDLRPISRLTQLERLTLDNNRHLKVIAPLSGLKNLKRLQIRDTKVSNISVLTKLRKLEVLWMDNTPVKDFSPLRQMKNLWDLGLYGTQISTTSHFRNLPLKYVNLRRTKITDFSKIPTSVKVTK